MDLLQIEKDIKEYLKEKDLELFSVKYLKKDETLEVLIDSSIDMDKLEALSNELSEYLDKYDNEFENNYILDVSTVGVERPIRNLEELNKAIGNYIYVKTKENEFNGTLKDVKDEVLNLEVKDKTKFKNVSIEYKNVKKVRYAVKF